MSMSSDEGGQEGDYARVMVGAGEKVMGGAVSTG